MVIDFSVDQPDSLYLTEFGTEPAHCRLFDYQNGNGVVFGAAAGGTPDYSYEWLNLTTGDTEDNTTWGGLNPGEYQLTVTDENGCTLIRTIQLDSIGPIANFNVISDDLNDDLQGTAPVTVEFENTSSNFYNDNDPFGDTTFFWALDNPVSGWEVTHDYFYRPDTVYGPNGQSYNVEVCLVALNKNGCSDTLCKDLTIYEAFDLGGVNIFTPNNDGANDVFTFEFQSASIAEFNCVIVNRWGVVMAELNDITEGWDGTDPNGDPAADGTYFYVYKAKTDNNTTLEGQGSVNFAR
jgi:gliding motility-associated-like protein